MMIHRILYKNALKLRTNTIKELQKLENLSEANTKRVEEYQRDALFELLNHAYQNTEYYKESIPKHIVTGNGSDFSADDIRNIPQLKKETLRSEKNRLLSKDHTERGSYRNKSGGSTGSPVEFYQDTEYLDTARAVKILFDRWTGYNIGDKKVRLWGSERDIFENRVPIITRFKRNIKNEVWLNSFQMTPSDMENYVNKINSSKPTQILGYAESTYELAKFIESKEHSVYSPDGIMTSAGKLYPHMRNKIKQVFEAPVYDRYGSREVGDIACECSNHEGLHISSPTHYVEVVDEDGNHVKKGEMGHVLVTSLTNYSMPFIRYRIGDMAIWGGYDYSCDLPFPILKEISGRETSMFYTTNEGVVSPEYFIHIIGVVLNPEWLEKFQVVQKKRDEIVVKLVTTVGQKQIEKKHAKDISEITESIQIVMGDNCAVEYKFVNEIPPADSGKYRYAVSEIA